MKTSRQKKERNRRMNPFFIVTLVCVPLFSLSCNNDSYITSPTTPQANLLSSVQGQSWMSRLPDTLLLSRITIPGTHESCALYDGVAPSGSAKCQDLSISDQLNIGVRFLDVRCRHYNDAFTIHHGPIFQNQDFDGVLNACFDFLAKHSTETIIMSVQEEWKAEGNTDTFEGAFYWYHNKNANGWYLGQSIPKLKTVRGKIVLLRSFSAQRYLPVGMPINDGQDNSPNSVCDSGNILQQAWYEVTDNNRKWGYVHNFLHQAVYDSSNRMYMNFTSGYLPTYPLWSFGTCIPDIHHVSDFINPIVDGYFSNCPTARYGIVIQNYINESLCEKIYSKN